MNTSEAHDEQFQYLTFGVHGEEYAIGILQVREIIGHRTPTIVPMTPDYVTGVINLRGSVVPVVDLALKFGMPGVAITKRTCIVIVDVKVGNELTMTGILVEGVHAVIDLPQAAAQLGDGPALLLIGEVYEDIVNASQSYLATVALSA